VTTEPLAPPDLRTRRVTALGAVCLAAGAWGLFFAWHLHLAFEQVARSFGWSRRNVRLIPSSTSDTESWAVAYCVAAALLMAIGGWGLLLRRRWAPRTVAVAAIAWIVSALASLSYHVNVVWTLRPSMQPRADGLRWMLGSYAAASLVAFAFGIVAAFAPFRPGVRRECEDGGEPPSVPATLAIGAWSCFCAWASTSCTQHFWYSVLF
jgi:hypothetical protein